MIEFRNKNILVLAPHTDDETVSCGGLIHRAFNEGATIHIIAFSWCFNPELIREFEVASKILCPTSTVENLNFQVREFHASRQKILETLINIKQRQPIDIVLCNSSFDIHQDHNVIHNEAKRAFKDKTILGFCNHWNVVGHSNFQITMRLTSSEIESKSKAMDCYKTQSRREYFVNKNQWIQQEQYELIICNL